MDYSPDNSLDSTFIQTLGTGSTLLVFHGGPGFDHRYLVPHLAFLKDRYKLVFFDQLGSGQTECASDKVSFEAICQHTASVVTHFQSQSRICVVAHSFGVAVLLGALKLIPNTRVSGGLLINSVPTNRARFEQMRAALFEKMGPEVTSALASISSTLLEGDALSPMLRFYLSPHSTADLDNLTFNFALYNQVYQSLGHFDLSDAVSKLALCDLITGTDDFIRDEMVADLITFCRSRTSISDSGHFPFAEQSSLFQSHAHRMLVTC